MRALVLLINYKMRLGPVKQFYFKYAKKGSFAEGLADSQMFVEKKKNLTAFSFLFF